MPVMLDELRKLAANQLGQLMKATLKAAAGVQTGNHTSLQQKEAQQTVLNQFVRGISEQFKHLASKESEEETQMLYFELLALAQKRELEEMITVEGMIASARNLCTPNFIPFNQRMNALLDHLTVDEHNNPLDPNQITTAFEQSVQFLNLDPLNRLALFRDFNEHLLKHLDETLANINSWLIERDILPELTAVYPEAAAVVNNANTLNDPELFSMMQGLLRKENEPSIQIENSDDLDAMVPTGSGIMQPVQFSLEQNDARRKIEVLESARLLEVLDSIQKSLSGRKPGKDLFNPYLVNEALGNLLSRNQQADTILAVDRNSSDVINLVTMLYAAIWQDKALPDPVKNLIGETQLSVTKLALSDTSFFNNERHPARELINELANTASEWAEDAQLDSLPIFRLMHDLVDRITSDFSDDSGVFEVALRDLRRSVLKEEREKLKELEDTILTADDRQSCIEDIHQLVTKRILERMTGRKIHHFFRESIENFFHKYLVLLVIKEGPQSQNWKQAIQTLDVLLWTLEFNKEEDDIKRVETANSGILNMLRKIFKASKLASQDIDTLIDSLLKAQKESLTPEENESEDDIGHQATDSDSKIENASHADEPIDAADEPYYQQVENFSVGTWVEITGLSSEPLRCRLAAKIKPLDKYIFVNRDGVKVAETNQAGLVSDLKSGNIQLVSDGMLFSRALESVIGNLQESQDQQQGLAASH